MPHIIYVDIESLIKTIGNCKHNSEKSSTTEIAKHIPCEYSVKKKKKMGIWSYRK